MECKAMMPLIVRGKTLNPHGHALICTPLTGRTVDALQAELAIIVPKRPDVVEWRADYFAYIHDAVQVVEVARLIRRQAGDIPLIFTRRAAHEGGEKIAIAEEDVVRLYEAVSGSGDIDIIDYELSQSAENRLRLRAASRAQGVSMIMSYHNFESTPTSSELVAKLVEAEQQDADIAKVAVMPQTTADVLVLLQATLAASQYLKIPLITMSMGAMGAMTRLCGAMFGSALTFAIGGSGSAPGQIAIEDLRAALNTLERAASGQ
jgi:3-dehydroquinate dehydratase I